MLKFLRKLFGSQKVERKYFFQTKIKVKYPDRNFEIPFWFEVTDTNRTAAQLQLQRKLNATSTTIVITSLIKVV